MFGGGFHGRVVAATCFPTARSYLALALACIAFAIYASLLPFDLRPLPVGEAWSEFRSSLEAPLPRRISRSDVLANALLFVPIGFALAGSLTVDRARRSILLAPLAVVPIALAASVAAEFLQIFALRRVPSALDVAAQLAGTFGGIALWGVLGQQLTGWVRDTLAAAHTERLPRLLAAYAAAWVFVGLAPFDITVDAGDLWDRVEGGRVTLVPFGGASLGWGERAWDVAAELLGAIPLGVLGTLGWRPGRRSTPLEGFATGAAIVWLVEAAQVFISSHDADTGDALAGCAGVALGVLAGGRLLAQQPGEAAPPRPDIVSWPALAVLCGWIAVICAYHWAPYDFALDGEMVRRKLAALSFVPFAGYGDGSYLNALNNLLTRLGLSMPIGVIAAFAVPRPARFVRAVTIAWLIAAACIFTAIEAGQFLLPTRVPDSTDVLIGVVSTFFGLVLGRWLQSPRPPGLHSGV